MKRRSKWTIAIISLIMLFSFTACGGSDDNQDSEKKVDAAIPKETAVSAEDWADKYAAMLESGEARDYADYDAMKATLDEIREECGATYVYALTPGTDGTPDINGEYKEGASFLITVDGGDDPDDWAEDYGWEVQFTEAWEGEPAAARSAWDDSDELQCWSAFAPVYDSEGNVVCILGIDYPCTEVIADYPEWNRDADEWNGYEDEIDEEIPTEIQEIRTITIELANMYANVLSCNK